MLLFVIEIFCHVSAGSLIYFFRFIACQNAGYEHSYVMRGKWQLYWQVKTEFVINGRDWLKTGVGIGVKF